jgi:hypothetical protein
MVGSPRALEVTDGQEILHGSILSNIARKRGLHRPLSSFVLSPKFPVRPMIIGDPVPTPSAKCKATIQRVPFTEYTLPKPTDPFTLHGWRVPLIDHPDHNIGATSLGIIISDRIGSEGPRCNPMIYDNRLNIILKPDLVTMDLYLRPRDTQSLSMAARSRK